MEAGQTGCLSCFFVRNRGLEPELGDLVDEGSEEEGLVCLLDAVHQFGAGG